MPNQPKTPIIGVRCPPELRARLERIAAERDWTLTDVCLRAMERYADEWPARD